METTTHTINVNEQLLSLAQAARQLPGRNGKTTHIATLHRWTRGGIKTPHGIVFLETMKVGGLCVTSREAIARFVEKLNSHRQQGSTGTPSGTTSTTSTPSTSKPSKPDDAAARRAAEAGKALERLGA